MNDKEFEELKRKVAEEEERRRKIEKTQERIKLIENAFNFKQPDGWVRHMKIKIIQDGDMVSGNDGNGPIRSFHHEAELTTTKECELLFEACKIMAKEYRKNLEDLEKEDKDAKD